MKPQPESQPGHLTWTCVINLEGLRHEQQAHLASLLAQADRWCGRQVTIRVGPLHPYDDRVDTRVAWFLSQALRRGVSLHLEGVPGPVANWLQTLRELSRADPPPDEPDPTRRLRVVTP